MDRPRGSRRPSSHWPEAIERAHHIPRAVRLGRKGLGKAPGCLRARWNSLNSIRVRSANRTAAASMESRVGPAAHRVSAAAFPWPRGRARLLDVEEPILVGRSIPLEQHEIPAQADIADPRDSCRDVVDLVGPGSWRILPVLLDGQADLLRALLTNRGTLPLGPDDPPGPALGQLGVVVEQGEVAGSSHYDGQSGLAG
jgi:hypothetical protein